MNVTYREFNLSFKESCATEMKFLKANPKAKQHNENKKENIKELQLVP